MTINLQHGLVIDNRYSLLHHLGTGGCASVWLANDLQHNNKCAIKIMSNGDQKRFHREVLIMRALTHENIVACIDGGKDKTCCFAVLEVVDGGSLADMINEPRNFSPIEAAWVVLQAVRGLKKTGVVHRDLKPANLMIKKGSKGNGLECIVNNTSEGFTVKVADFGLAKSFEDKQNFTHTQEIMGTPSYMSPEQCRSTRDAKVESDIYSMGTILYELVTGKPPFTGGNVYETIKMQIEAQPYYPGWFSGKLKPIVEKCLQKKASDRYRSWGALEADLNKVLGIEQPSFWKRLFGGSNAAVA